ncbi:tRNA uridine-5-carboxymethylaminomethyl(34) synthesis GTPase MnmE [Parasediminibacterium paludis]|uniref:tRNA modification GTPase MnmE n=1 Tax=Parasediminibacterium paludis TaxID=908966 RepID=A0ABV8PX45_9BACT
MRGKLSGWDDTIVALATPPGVGAIGVIRVSGSKVFCILDELFTSKKISIQPSHTILVGLLKDAVEVLDEVVLAIFKNPKSYTGEDVVEISCHGSPFIQEKIINTLVKKGCRIAKPGEFTQRAFLNGKLDLTQAEAVADLIASNTEASRNAAINNMRGGFSSSLSVLREQLIRFSAMIELELDFAQEDVEFADRSALSDLISELITSTNSLLHSFKLGNVIKNGVQVAIIGKPNAGKSTLLNTLLNENRAIVSDIAGTTRDTIEEVLNIEGVLFRLIDTAGIRLHTTDVIESIGVEKSFEKMRSANLVVYLFDVHNTTTTELQAVVNDFQKEALQYLLVGNKIDAATDNLQIQFNAFGNVLFISAKDHINIDYLKKKLVEIAVGGNINTEATIITNARHHEALQQLATSLNDIRDGLNHQISGDLLALDIRQSLHYLGLITGEITNDDQLDFIFSKFCIGK